MRPLLLVALTGCATVEHRDLLEHTVAPETCVGQTLIATAYPGDWPDVFIEIRDEQRCEARSADTVRVTHQLHVPRETSTIIAAVLGGGIALGAELALLANLEAKGSYSPIDSSPNRGDALLALPLLGALGGAVLVNNAAPALHQTIGQETRVEAHVERREREAAVSDAELTFAAESLGAVRGGRARVPLEVATRVYGGPLYLGARRVEWSVRQGAWVPGALPACTRAAAVWQARGFEQLSADTLSRASDDAEACASDGWPFATSMVGRLAEVCRERWHRSCADVHDPVGAPAPARCDPVKKSP